MASIAITATASYTPEQVLTNDELVERFGLSVDSDWIVRRTGIESRHWLRPDETTSDIAVRAAARCLERARVAPSELDRIILATVSPDLPSPSTATIVARKLGARCMAFDIAAACSGFLYGLDLGAASILAGARRVLVIGADARSRYLDPKDHRALVLFADGAGCALLERSHDGAGFLAIECGAEGVEGMGVHIPAGGAARPASAETVARGEHYMRIDSKHEIFALFLRFSREICERALERAELRVEDIDLFIPHQGNGNLIKMVAKELGFDPSLVVDDIASHGNTAGASVAIALDEARRSGRIRPGSKVLMTAAGAGCTFAAAVHRF